MTNIKKRGRVKINLQINSNILSVEVMVKIQLKFLYLLTVYKRTLHESFRVWFVTRRL